MVAYKDHLYVIFNPANI